MEIKKYAIFSHAAVFAVLLLALGYNANAQLPPDEYCGSTPTPPSFNASCSSGSTNNWAYITGVSTTGGSTNFTNNNTGCGNSTTNYSDYTGTSMKVTQTAGQTVDVKVGWAGNSSNNIVNTLTRIYVDWDRDGFFDQNEYIAPPPFQGTHPHAHGTGGVTITITVPGYAKEGLTRMRVITSALNFIYDPNGTACNGSYGEAEDYVFEVVNPCLPPDVISISNIDFESGDFSWTPKPNAEFYEYVITTADSIPDDTVIGFTFTTNTSVDVDTFECETKYYILVRAICDTANKAGAIFWDKSAWIRDSFTTQPCCYSPDLKFDRLSYNSARVTWDPIATALGYEYAVSTITTPPQQGTYTINTSVLVQGLSPKTTYFIHVRSRCSPTPLSEWSNIAFKTLGGLSVDDIDAGAFSMSVYPNPASDVINVELSTKPGNNAMVTVSDVTGKVIYTLPATSDKIEINASTLAAGMYIIQYADDEHTEVMRVTKQ